MSVIAPIAEIRSCGLVTLITGVCPRGAQVRRTNGESMKPASSRNMMYECFVLGVSITVTQYSTALWTAGTHCSQALLDADELVPSQRALWGISVAGGEDFDPCRGHEPLAVAPDGLLWANLLITSFHSSRNV